MIFRLKQKGISNVQRCQDSLEVMALLKGKEFSLILFDILMPGIRGNELLPKIVEEYPHIPVIMLTAINEVEIALECLNAGAFSYLVKPAEDYQWLNAIKNALGKRESNRENIRLKECFLADGPQNPDHFKEIITQDKKMIDILKYVEAIAESPESVLITGETGVGKELIARAIHKASLKEGKFVAVNVAGLDDTLFTDTLFGHKKGAYTDANENRDGLILTAQNGTLLLDEIGDLSMKSQIKLLRLLQEKEYQAPGYDKPRKTNARIVVASNRDLEKLIEEGKFRHDLYYRLDCHSIHIPPLRERKGDIPILMDHFIEKASTALKKGIIHVPESLLKILLKFDFPGNIRELDRMIYDAVSRSNDNTLSITCIEEKIQKTLSKRGIVVKKNPVSDLLKEDSITFGSNFPTYRQAKKAYLEEALNRAGGNQSLAAKFAGLHRTTFLGKLKRVDEPEENIENEE